MNSREPEDDLRKILQPRPTTAPDDIDMAIRAHAREALVRVPTRGAPPQSRSSGWLLRTLPVAAVVVLAIGVIPRIQQEPTVEVTKPALAPPSAPPTSQSAGIASTESLSSSAREVQNRMADAAAEQNEARLESNRALSDAAEEALLSSSDDVVLRAKRSDLITEEIMSFAAEPAPLATDAAELSAAPLQLQDADDENEALPILPQTEAENILALLRAQNEDEAMSAYNLWRASWPDVEPVPSIMGMSREERDWFEEAASAYQPAQ